MAATKRTRFERERDLGLIAGLYCEGKTQVVIAERVGLTQQQISLDLKVVRERWLKASIESIDAAKGRELAKVDHLELTYWEAWERSLVEKQITATKKRQGLRVVGKDEQAATTEASIRKEQRDGNPSYLAGVQWCIERRCKIMGTDAPTKVAPTDPTGTHEYDPITARERLASRLASIAARCGAAELSGGPNRDGSPSATP